MNINKTNLKTRNLLILFLCFCHLLRIIFDLYLRYHFLYTTCVFVTLLIFLSSLSILSVFFSYFFSSVSMSRFFRIGPPHCKQFSSAKAYSQISTKYLQTELWYSVKKYGIPVVILWRRLYFRIRTTKIIPWICYVLF